MRALRSVVPLQLVALICVWTGAWTGGVPLRAQVPDPVAFFGHEIGADHRLVDYTDLLRYFEAVAARSDRVRIADIGTSSYGQRMVMAVISSPKNLANLARLREIDRVLAHAEVDDAEAAKLCAEGKALVWIDAGLHATECIAGQNILELVWRMASRDDAEVRRILDEVVLLACPVNPDGYELVGRAYRATQSTATPVLYQRYIGHDNNRDYYACNQVETQNVSRVFYRDWCPQVVYNHHQSAPRGTIIFTPPFRDPFNYYVDPMCIRGIEVVSAHMNDRFAAEGKPGVISRSGAPYSGWWNGGLRSTNYFHNVIGILTESFGRPEPTDIEQTLSRRLPTHDYPDPVASQTWHARQTIEYLQTANFAILDYAARYRQELLRNIHTMATRAVARGRSDHWTPTPKLVAEATSRNDDTVWKDPAWRDPRAYVLRRDQPDWPAALRLARALWHCGVALHRANTAFELDGATIPAGSLIVKCDQPYRAHVLDMFEPQWHPDDIRDGKPVPPYDAAGWTLAMQMNVQVVRCRDALEGTFARLTELPTFEPGSVPIATAGWRIDARDSHAVTVVNRLLAAGCAVDCAQDHFFVPSAPRASAVLLDAARTTGVTPASADAEGSGTAAQGPRARLSPVRTGLFDVFGGHMATGWDLWLLREFGFPVQQVWGERVEAGSLRRDFDVLIFHTGLPGPRDLNRANQRKVEDKIPELQAALPPFEDWSDLPARAVRLTGDKSLPALREFVQQGGTLIAMGSEVEKVVRHFELPIETGTRVAEETGENGEGSRATTAQEFFVPGSLLAIEVDTGHAIARGSPALLAAMVDRGSTVLAVTDPNAKIDVVARFRPTDTLLSGWAIGTEFLHGKAAVLCAHVGQGRVVLFGIDATYRGQPLATARMVFQAILTAGERQ